MSYPPSDSEIERMIDEQGAEYLDRRDEFEREKITLLDSIAAWAEQTAVDIAARHTPGRYKASTRKMVQLDLLLAQIEWTKSK